MAVRLGQVGWRPTTGAVKAVSWILGNTEVLILLCLDNTCFYLMDEETGAMATSPLA
jgi:hypothetical protein